MFQVLILDRYRGAKFYHAAKIPLQEGKMNRKSKVLVLGSFLALVLFLGSVATAADVEPKMGQQVNYKFGKPMSDDDAKYLGLEKAGEFTVKDVKAPYLLVEQMSTTCPYCATEAGIMNTIFSRVQQDPELKNKVRIVAEMQGDTGDKVKAWKDLHKVAFPMIPDPESTLGDALNFHPYPVTFVLDKKGKIVYLIVGEMKGEDVNEVLSWLKDTLK
jgi:peroxiredoxin